MSPCQPFWADQSKRSPFYVSYGFSDVATLLCLNDQALTAWFPSTRGLYPSQIQLTEVWVALCRTDESPLSVSEAVLTYRLTARWPRCVLAPIWSCRVVRNIFKKSHKYPLKQLQIKKVQKSDPPWNSILPTGKGFQGNFHKINSWNSQFYEKMKY